MVFLNCLCLQFAVAYSSKEVVFKWKGPDPVAISPDVTLSQYEFLNITVANLTTYGPAGGEFLFLTLSTPDIALVTSLKLPGRLTRPSTTHYTNFRRKKRNPREHNTMVTSFKGTSRW